jgi:alpha-galactosidase
MTTALKHRWVGIAALFAGTLCAHGAPPAREDFQSAHEWLTRARLAAPFSFTYGNESSHGLLPHWKLQKSERTASAGVTEHHWTYRDGRTGLEVEWVLTEYANFPAFEWVLHFRNTADQDTPVLENVLPLDAPLGRAAAGTVPLLEYARGSHNEFQDFAPLSKALPEGESAQFAPYGGRSSDGYLPFFQLFDAHGTSVTLGIGWTGQWAASFRNRGSRGVTATAGMERARFRLHPGEAVRTPAILMQFWQGGDRNRGHNLWRALLLRHYSPREGDGPAKLPVALSVHGVHGFEKTTEANMLEAVEAAAQRKFGFDTFWIDAGWLTLLKNNWAASVGNIEADPSRFGHGLKPVGEAAHRNGMKFLVWFEPERVMPNTWLARNHPGWLLQPPTSIPVEDGYMRKDKFQLLDLGNPDALKWLVDWASGQIGAGGIDIYRQDFNMYPLEYWRAGEAEDRQGMREIRHITNLYAYWDALRQRFPHLLIDNCASGGRRIDFEMLRRSVVLWRTDKVWDNLAATQAMSYGLSLWIPIHALGAVTTEPYAFRSGLGAAGSFPFDFRSDAVAAQARPALQAFRTIQRLYEADYYPLTVYSLKPDVWMAWQYHRPESGEGFVQAFRREESKSETQTYPLHGLDPQATYSLTDWDRPGERCLSGRELMQTGIEIKLPAPHSATVLVYRRQDCAQR